MDTKQVIARFEAERQALAMMEHPNIAKVLEAGATETGRPYFVMELVKGITITEYCDRNELTTRQRLDLFIQVCSAIQHAHQKGVIHRDIKPSNVLVTLHDIRPVPKVIDFGIAKATSRRLTEKTLFTEFRHFIGTPEYMSPDQAEISGLDVDTRTDVYSLGVLLYELLTGTTPFDSATLRQAAYGEIQRILREVQPPKPSTRLDTLAEEGTDIAKHRQTEPGALSKLMRGDLDWIVMKAIEKDRTRRYQSASELAADIERYLHRQPILAGPPSVIYKLRRFVSRHQLGVVAGILIAAAMLFGLISATIGLVEARQEAERSQTIVDFLEELFISTDPEQAMAREVDVGRVMATARELFGDDHATVAAILSSRALQLQSSGELESAERAYRESLRIWREQLGEDNINVGTTLSRLGLLLLTKGDDQAAEEAFRESLRITKALRGEESLAICESLGLLATVLANRGEFDEAEALLRESARVREAVAPHQRLQIALAHHSLANILAIAGKRDELRDFAPQTIAAWREALPEGGLLLARLLTEYGLMYREFSEMDTAERLLQEAAEIFRLNTGPPARLRTVALLVLSGLLKDRGALGEAVQITIEALDVAQEYDIDQYLDDAVKGVGDVSWLIARDADRSGDEYKAALSAIERILDEQPDKRACINTQGILHYRLGQYEEALTALARSHALYSQDYETGVPADLAFMAMAHHKLGHDRDAEQGMGRLRAAMENPELARSEDNQAHLAEAEAMLGAPTSDD
jgi:tetratricopeptide (TPR) repeat protein